MFCKKCGARLEENTRSCSACGAGTESSSGSGVDALIPYRNAPALVAYYTGVFSLIPCIAVILGPAAIIAGIMGLSRAAKHPEARGRAHAWTGIICGLVTIGYHVGFAIWLSTIG